MENMERIDRILRCSAFRENLAANEAAEKDRVFCRHDMSHFLDVARIGVILSLEEGLAFDREMIYAAALLHDIGKHKQYSHGIPHERASAEIAPEILESCGFDEKETTVIINAILAHRDPGAASGQGLEGVLYRADKASRPCFACPVQEECSWKDGKKNLRIRY